MVNFILAVICGIAGGALNCILFHNGFAMPSREKGKENNRDIIDPGFIGNLCLGGGASIIMYGFGANEFTLEKMIAVSFLSGIGGGSFIVNMLQSKHMDIQQFKIESLNKISKQLVASKKNSKPKKIKQPES